jgi:hypothetical protein
MPVSVSEPRDPKYRHYKPKNLGVVRINGHDEYLGRYNSPESRERYHRLIAEWIANGRQSLPQPADKADESPPPLSVNDLILAYWQYAKTYYVKNGSPTREIEEIRMALRPLRHLYGSPPQKSLVPKNSEPSSSAWSKRAFVGVSSMHESARSSERSSGPWPRSWSESLSTTGSRP